MPRYAVISREYGTVVPILDDGTGPTEYGCEYAEVEADTPKGARVKAVREWRSKGRLRYCYSDENPFTGLKVQDIDKMEQQQDNADAKAAYEEHVKNPQAGGTTTDF